MPNKITFLAEDNISQLKKNEQEEIRARAIGVIVQCMKRFFKGKPYYKSLPSSPIDIPQDILISQTNIGIIINADDLNEAMKLIEDAIQASCDKNKHFAQSGEITKENESKLYLKLISEFRSLEIPFQFQGGMMLLYFWLCEGIEFE